MTQRIEYALPYLEEAVRRAPREINYRTLLAEACLRQGDVERAIEILASSIDRASKPRTIYVLALALLASDRNGEAKSAATEALRLNPAMDRAYLVRGLARRSQGDLSGALADLRAATDARPDSEFALALARTVLEAAIASSPVATESLLQRALRLLDGVAPSESEARERQHLGALLAFALNDPVAAVERLGPVGQAADPKLALLRGYALLATGRGAEATTDLRLARDFPETKATATRLLTAFRERGRVNPTFAEAVLAGGEPSWPELRSIAARLLPPPADSWPFAPERHERTPADDSTDLDFDPLEGPAPRTPGSEIDVALESARAFLAEGRHDAAVRELEHAWELVRPGTSPLPAAEPVPRHRLQALAEALAAAYAQSSAGVAPRRAREEELYAAGARYPALLRSLVWRFTDDEPREDAFALDVLVTAIESPGALARETTRDVLRRLAAALRLDLDDDLDAAQTRVQLLERLHRARPGLAFPRLYLGRHALLTGDPERALAFLVDLAGPLARSPQVLMLRASCAESLGDAEGALELYRAAHARAPQLPDLSYRIGRALIRRSGAAASESPTSAPRVTRPADESMEAGSP